MDRFKYLLSILFSLIWLINSYGQMTEANFGVDKQSGCSPFSVHFIDSSTVRSGTILSWHWDFGDGKISSIQHPFHTYDNPGNYKVILTIKVSNGDEASVTAPDYIHCYMSPDADFMPNPEITTMAQPTIKFENSSRNITTATVFNWCFDDFEVNPANGGISTDRDPVYKYSDTGAYTVSLVVTNDNSCRDTVLRQLIIYPPDPELITFFDYPFFDKLGVVTIPYYYYPIYVLGSQVSLEVYDINGNRVFYSDKNCRGWEGSYMANGKFTPNGIYIVRLRYLKADKTWYDETKKVFITNTSARY